MDLATWRVQFPEFARAPDALCQAMLTAAALEIDPDVWRTKADQGQAYLAAHKLALSPNGQNAKMMPQNSGNMGLTTYLTHFRALRAQVASGYRLA